MIPENPTFPFTITKRNGKATIYRRDKVKGTGTYPEYRLAFYDSAGKRHLESFSEFPTALKTANARLDALLQGTADVLTLSGSQRLDYLQATKLLPPGVTLTEAVKGYQRLRRADDVTAISVSDLVAEFIQTRTNQTRHGRPASDAYVRDLRLRLTRFGDAFQCDVSDVTAKALEGWFDKNKVTGRNRFNTVRLIRTVSRWAQKRGNLRSGVLETDKLDLVDPGEGEIEIFTPEELESLLSVSKPTMIPYFALGAFAGLRTAEIQRLTWEDYKSERGFIEVGRSKAKTRSRRLVPILSALKSWLDPIQKVSGEVLPFASLSKQIVWVARDAGVEWKHNGLRHSFISYRLADVQNVDRVALEAGNSPPMIFKHYRELVTPAEAEKWFATTRQAPGGPQKDPIKSQNSDLTGNLPTDLGPNLRAELG